MNTRGSTWPDVSVIMAVRNEARHLHESVGAILSQDYPGSLDVTVAAAPSSDGTADVLDTLAKDGRVRVVDNPAGTTPAGLNAALRACTGAVVVRVDGHAVIPPSYVRTAVEVLQETGADNVGGIMAAEGETPFERAVAAAEVGHFDLAYDYAYEAALMAAEHGTVRIQAQTMRPATPHRTAENFRTLPAPTIAPVIVWVVETGMPSAVAR